MMIVYIKRDYGGAYKCYKHAQELGVPIMNIADNIKNQEWYTADSKRFDFSFMPAKNKTNLAKTPLFSRFLSNSRLKYV